MDIEDAKWAGIEQGRTEAIRDAIIDLRDSIKDSPEHERAGIRAAIEILQANFPH